MYPVESENEKKRKTPHNRKEDKNKHWVADICDRTKQSSNQLKMLSQENISPVVYIFTLVGCMGYKIVPNYRWRNYKYPQ